MREEDWVKRVLLALMRRPRGFALLANLFVFLKPVPGAERAFLMMVAQHFAGGYTGEKLGHRQAIAERDRYIRYFNRLENAVRRHIEFKEKPLQDSDEADARLASAHRAVMRDATKGEG